MYIIELCAKKDRENVALQKRLEAAYQDAESNLSLVKEEFTTAVKQLQKEKLVSV